VPRLAFKTQRYFPTDVSRVKLPVYNSKDSLHEEIVQISKNCHSSAVGRGDLGQPSAAELQLAAGTASFWGIPKSELTRVISYYKMIITFRSRGAKAEERNEEDEREISTKSIQ